MSSASILRLGYGSGGSAALVLRLGYLAGATPPPPVVTTTTVPGPADGPDDLARRRWLEWRDKKYRRRQVVERPVGAPSVQPTRAPREAPIIERPLARVIDATPAFRLLAENHAAMLAQRDALAAAERERNEEEDLLALLLEDL